MSKIDELNTRTPTHAFTVRLDARHLATLIRFWHDRGELPRSASELLRLSVESFVESLVLQHKIDYVQRLEDALEVIKSAGFGGKKNTGVIARALAAEGVSFVETPHSIDRGHSQSQKENPVSFIEIDAASQKLEERMGGEMAERIKKEQENAQEFKDNMVEKP